MAHSPAVSVIIPAHNEAETIVPCLKALLASKGELEAQVLVVANGCSDDTVAQAQRLAGEHEERGWSLEVHNLTEGGKTGALNAGDAATLGPVRVYLDADVVVSPPLLAQLIDALSIDAPAYGSGTLHLAPPKTATTRAYARIYAQVPFMTTGVQGAGLFAVNAAGRARWDDWPEIISDDTYARLMFATSERHKVAADYDWPLVEGWDALVRVRRRQDLGVQEIAARFPELLGNDDKPPFPKADQLKLALRDPCGFAVYAGVALATKLRRSTAWERGR